MSNIIEKKLFRQIFDLKFETLANKLINPINKEKNQITVNNINKNENKLYEEEKTRPYNYVIQPSNRRVDLLDAVNLILDFN